VDEHFLASLIASKASIEAAPEPVKLFQGIGKEAARSAADLLSNPLPGAGCAQGLEAAVNCPE
jgi:hypothetical protein